MGIGSALYETRTLISGRRGTIYTKKLSNVKLSLIGCGGGAATMHSLARCKCQCRSVCESKEKHVKSARILMVWITVTSWET